VSKQVDQERDRKSELFSSSAPLPRSLASSCRYSCSGLLNTLKEYSVRDLAAEHCNRAHTQCGLSLNQRPSQVKLGGSSASSCCSFVQAAHPGCRAVLSGDVGRGLKQGEQTLEPKLPSERTETNESARDAMTACTTTEISRMGDRERKGESLLAVHEEGSERG